MVGTDQEEKRGVVGDNDENMYQTLPKLKQWQVMDISRKENCRFAVLPFCRFAVLQMTEKIRRFKTLHKFTTQNDGN